MIPKTTPRVQGGSWKLTSLTASVRNYEGSWLDWVQQEEARGQASKIKEDDD